MALMSTTEVGGHPELRLDELNRLIALDLLPDYEEQLDALRYSLAAPYNPSSAPWTRPVDWAYVDLTPRVCVMRGVRYLDATYPNWVDNLDIDLLDVASCLACVLGQLNGAYGDSPEVRDRSATWLLAHGFLWDVYTLHLNGLWRAAVLWRRG